MLEKLAEIVREQTSEAFKFGDSIICAACDFRPCNEPMCNETPHCPDTMSPDGSLMLARWAVLLVAKGLTYEADGITPKIWTEDTMQVALMNLIAEAKEGTNDAV